jgi:glycosyltransferase involved in cell wall biosynthesis
MNKNHVLFIISSGQVGGAQEFVKNQIKMLFDSGAKIYLITNEKKWLYDNVKSFLDGFILDNKIEKISFYNFIRIIEFIKKNNIDLIIGNSAMGGVYSRVCSYISKVPVIYVSHGWSSVYNGGFFSFIFNKVEFLFSFISTKILCVSYNDFKIASEIIGINKTKLEIISNSICPTINSNVNTEVNKIKLIAVSRLAHPKRLDLLIEAVGKISDVHLSIVGDGVLKNELNNKIINDNINNVDLIGEIPSFNDYFNFDIFVLISESEGLPISAIEAMSSGLALILSNVGGCPELINNNGILVENSVDSIVLGILDCISNKKIFQQNSLSHFDNNFNLEKNKFAYLNLYNSAIIGKSKVN